MTVMPGGRAPDDLATELFGKRDMMSGSMVVALANVETELTNDGWDQPAKLLVVARDLAPTDMLSEGEDAFILGMTEAPVDLRGLDGLGIADAIRVLADHARELKAKLGEDSWEPFGWVLTHEAWALSAVDAGGPAALWRTGNARKVNQHPKKVEVRILVGVDRAGGKYQLIRPRNGPPEVTVGELHGNLPDALVTLMEATA